ncbi:MAG: sigma-70 family RNA polymerase sigma factor [Saprospiraceae bacterium]|nr:sigma-70 family RNA polymerase sigma factor [Saprospiraceae bacterium]
MDLVTFQNTILPIKDKLFRFALRIVGNPMEAEDVVQEVFIKMWNNRYNMAEIKNHEAWCMSVTRNLSIDKVRSKFRRETGIPEGTDWRDEGLSPHKSAELTDAVSRVRQLMETLPESQRRVMELRDIEEMSYQEIADLLELTMEQVKVYLHRARKTIRQQLIQSESYGLQ